MLFQVVVDEAEQECDEAQEVKAAAYAEAASSLRAEPRSAHGSRTS